MPLMLLRLAFVGALLATPLFAQRAVGPQTDRSGTAVATPVRSSRSDATLPHRTAPQPPLKSAVASRGLAGSAAPAPLWLPSLGPGDSIGYTYYDLQTNSSMTDRVVNWPNDAMPLGAVASTAIWMASVDPAPATGSYAATLRGTYGAVQDAASREWLPMGGAWERREDRKTGFPEIGRLSDGRHIVANHGTPAGIQVWLEVEPGSSEWFRVAIPGGETGLWVSMAVSDNDNVHLIWTTAPSMTTPSQVWYSRSIDAGENFSDAVQLTGPESVVLPDIRSGYRGSSFYCIAARGDNVAVWYLSSSIELLQLRSFDGGASWPSESAFFVFRPLNEHRYHDTEDPAQRLWPDPEFGADTAVGFRTDTVPGPGSSLDLLMDSEGRTHGAVTIYPTYVRRYYPPGGDTTATTFLSGIIYQADHNYVDAGLLYISELNGELRRSFVPQPGGLVNGPGEPTYYIRRSYLGGWSLYPQLGLDAASNVYLTFTSGIAGDVQQAQRRPDSLMKDWLLHHTFVTWTRADDTEMRWMAPRNLTPNGVDAKYAALADLVDDELHIAYQVDPIVGEMIPDTLAPIARLRNNVEVLQLSTETLDDPTGVDVIAGGELASFVTVSPNPARRDARVDYRVAHAGVVSLTIVDVIGQVARTIVDRQMPAGSYSVRIDELDLPGGQYYIVLRTRGDVSTAPLQIVP